jgi:hypothetical protein
MVFNRKGFFLTFDEAADKKPATVAPLAPVAPAPAEEAPVKVAVAVAVATQVTQAKPAAEAGAGKTVLTTAEALAAELRQEELNRPAPSLATFAPANLTPGGALPVRRRRGGANLAPFRAIGASLFSK